MRLRYREIGNGEPVVLIHGLTRSLEDWVGLGDSLAVDHRVIAFDLRGFGQSSKFADPARFGPEMAADVVRLLDHLRVGRAHLVGHSLGALLVSYAAVHYPERVATVSLVAGPFFEDSASAAQAMAPVVAGLEQGKGMRAFFRQFVPEMPDSLADMFSRQMMATNDLGSLIGVTRTFGSYHVGQAGAKTARVPALFAVGTVDNLLARSRDMASRWPGARLVEIAGADHVDVLGRPELLVAVRSQLRVRTASRATSERTPAFARSP